jgi:DNA-dependent RNA polymerase auxiliary subunit epsilon
VIELIFKVFVQESADQIPVREKTKAVYIEAESEREVRKKMEGTPYNIEYIQALSEAHLEYEKKSPNFKLLEL